MALAQTGMVRDRIVAANPGLETEIVVVSTVADRILDRPLSEIGGKGLFTKELEQALFADAIDVAVHSMKDVETWLPDGLAIACILERDDPRDAFLTAGTATGFADLPAGSRVGTSSLRRGAQVLMHRPDLRIVPLRGNANTRMRKLEAGECDATLLALAGLQRLGMENVARCVLSVEEMLPAVAQGALGIECRAGTTISVLCWPRSLVPPPRRRSRPSADCLPNSTGLAGPPSRHSLNSTVTGSDSTDCCFCRTARSTGPFTGRAPSPMPRPSDGMRAPN